jgi:PAS domain S-box-containing protein
MDIGTLGGKLKPPISQSDDLAHSAELPIAPVRESLRLLVIEDSDADYELLTLLLQRAGYDLQARRVETERDMVAALEAQDWDLIIADNRLPHFSSTAAMNVVRSTHRDLPFIIVSGEMEEDAAVASLLHGADDYITKGRLTRLVPAIERSLRAAEARRMRRLAEHSLRDSESRLRALAGNTPGMLFEAYFDNGAEDRGLRFSYVSEGSRELVGLAPEELMESAEALLKLLDLSDRASLLSRIEPSAEMAGIVRWEGRAYLDESEGGTRWLQIGASHRVGADLRLIWTGVITDITALKKAEAELFHSRDELRGLSAHLAQTREAERARIALEIHDDIGGLLTGLRADIAWLRRHAGADEKIAEKLQYMSDLVDSAAAASVRIQRDLRPAVLDFGFVSAMEWLARDFRKHAGISCEFSCNNEEAEIELGRATAVFRIFQELLTNITKHADAQHVSAHLHIDDENIILEVADDGRGVIMHNRRKQGSFGIRGMRERALELGGSFSISAGPKGGTLAVLRAPRLAGPPVGDMSSEEAET